jgi:LysM repeat protein
VKYFFRLTLFFALAGIFSSGMLAANDQTHVVSRGDTIYSISRQYSVSADELMRVNNITDPSRLQIGNRLRIPAAQGAAAGNTTSTASTTTTSATLPQNLADYRVVRGDTLFSIARSNDIPLQTLLDINRFSANHVIRVGDVIKVPAGNATNVTSGTQTNQPGRNNPGNSGSSAPAGIYALRWPVTPKEITYMTGQMGVVVEGERNESVKSLTAGNVISAGPWRKFGRVVIVETSGGYFYMYGGCEILSVSVGDRITPGTEVGKLGVSTVSDKPQLFFMVFRSDTPIDPALAPRAGGNTRI